MLWDCMFSKASMEGTFQSIHRVDLQLQKRYIVITLMEQELLFRHASLHVFPRTISHICVYMPSLVPLSADCEINRHSDFILHLAYEKRDREKTLLVRKSFEKLSVVLTHPVGKKILNQFSLVYIFFSSTAVRLKREQDRGLRKSPASQMFQQRKRRQLFHMCHV